jgi:hypothetical protein
MKHYPPIRTIYLYLFTLIGLALLTVGFIKLVDLGLKMYVFPKAENETYRSAPPLISSVPPLITVEGPLNNIISENVEEIAEVCKENSELSEEQKKLLGNWLKDYKEWKEWQTDSGELKKIKRQRDASWAFSLILVGLPLYLFHWRIIRKETKNNNEDKNSNSEC